jgi:hypothetical protein
MVHWKPRSDNPAQEHLELILQSRSWLQLDRALTRGLFDLDDFAALVITALGAGAMRHLALVAVGAFGERLGF